jgi:hypothetical protein
MNRLPGRHQPGRRSDVYIMEVNVVEMTTYGRMSRVFQHQEPDRVPIMDGPWESTLARWRREGLPEDIEWDDYFDIDRRVTKPISTPSCLR